MMAERDTVLHSWCVQADWEAPTIVGGEGAHFIDAAGRRYLDMSSLAECMNLGHQHPAVVRAIQAQAEKLCFVTARGARRRARRSRSCSSRRAATPAGGSTSRSAAPMPTSTRSSSRARRAASRRA